ncbi:transmembrane protein 53-like isoform X1 [Amphiura filiformis]|uniref:transmembrane protein 53-like isoform X1 n=1 Tax=Amphiura filiformis TaxID=82378 RepID=UPI003B210AEB
MIRAAAGMHMRRPSLASLASNASAELPWQPGFVRFYASPSNEPPTPEIKICENLSLQKSPIEQERVGEKRPLVLLLSWLAAKQRHLSNFAQFYLDQGCDVLTVKVKPMQILLPETGAQVIAQNVANFVQSDEQCERPILVHGFSVGAYVYTEILSNMLALQKENEITGRIIGQIWDSPVDAHNIPNGISKALLKNNMMQIGVKKSLDLYTSMTYRIAGQHHQRGSRLFHCNPVKAPSMFFYSDSDPISTPDNCGKVMASLKEMGHTFVQSKEFKKSLHVSHMYKHREEYVSTLRGFLNQIDYFKKVSETDGEADMGSCVDTGETEKQESSV